MKRLMIETARCGYIRTLHFFLAFLCDISYDKRKAAGEMIMNHHNNWVSVWGNAVSVAENRPER